MPRPSSRPKHPLSLALVELRSHLGETQQQFASRLGVAITTVARYETTNPPSGKVLERLAFISSENGLDELSTTFQRAALAQTEHYVRLQDLEELVLCTAVLWIVRKPEFQKLRRRLAKLIQPVLDEVAAKTNSNLGVELALTEEGQRIYDLNTKSYERHDNETPNKER